MNLTEQAPPPALIVLRALARGQPVDLAAISASQLESLVQGGLGPLLRNLSEPSAGAENELVQAADLTARVLISELMAATADILRSAAKISDQLVLLKGIACQRHYPEPHHRLMGDVDILVPRHLRLELEAVLQKLGYVQRSELPPRFYLTHHHSMPFFHARTGIWIEVHTDLFPASNPAAHDACFSIDQVLANTVPIAVDGTPARALNDELHLLYTCSHWASALNIERGLIPIVDVIFLLRTRNDIDWQRIARWLRDSPVAATHLALMLGYLSTRNVVALDSAAIEAMNLGILRLGRINAKLLHRIVDALIVERKPFGRFATHYNTLLVWDTLLRPLPPLRNLAALPLLVAFPPGRTDRFSAKLALKRLWAVIRP